MVVGFANSVPSDTDFWMAEVQNQQSRECKHKGEKGLRINVQSFDVDEHQRAFSGSSWARALGF